MLRPAGPRISSMMPVTRSLGRYAEPLANNGSGLVRISFGEFTDAVHGLRVDLALNLGDVDQRGGAAGGKQGLTGRAVSAVRTAIGQRRRRAAAGQGRYDF